MVECLAPFTGHCDLDLWPSFLETSCPEHISYISKDRNPKFGGWNLGWWGVTYHFMVTLTLTSDLVCRIIVFRPYLLYYLRWESEICCMGTSLDADVSHTIFRSL